jgi:hypothetical protein
LRPHIVEVGIDAIADGFVDHARYADTAGLGEAFQPGRHINALAMDIFAVIDDVAKIGAHAEFEAAGL